MNLVSLASQFEKQFPLQGMLAQSRQKSMARLQSFDWPTRKNESWKYTSLQSYRDKTFQLEPQSNLESQSESMAQAISVQAPGCKVTSLSQASSSPQLDQWLNDWSKNQAAAPDIDGFLPTVIGSFSGNGVFIQVPDGVSIEKPVRIHVPGSSESQSFRVHQVWIDLGIGSKADFVLTCEGAGFNAVDVKIKVQPSAKGTFLRLGDLQDQATEFFRAEIQIQKQSDFSCWNLAAGGTLQRNELLIQVLGSEATVRAWGISIAEKSQVIDHHTVINHVSGGSQTEQLYKGLLSGSSRLVFDGQVRIGPGADKASSEQLNKNLILDGSAEVDSKPQLQVLADDVKATHGSATGQLNAEELFYFQSRGIPAIQARKILATGFVQDLIERHPVKEVVEMVQASFQERLTRLTGAADLKPSPVGSDQ